MLVSQKVFGNTVELSPYLSCLLISYSIPITPIIDLFVNDRDLTKLLIAGSHGVDDLNKEFVSSSISYKSDCQLVTRLDNREVGILDRKDRTFIH